MASAAARGVGAASTTFLGHVAQLSGSGRRRRATPAISSIHSVTNTWSLGIVEDRSSAIRSTTEVGHHAVHQRQTGADSLATASSHHPRGPATTLALTGRRDRSSSSPTIVSAASIAAALVASAPIFAARAEEVATSLSVDSALTTISLPDSGFPAVSLPTEIFGVDPAVAAGGAIAIALPAVVVSLLTRRPAAKDVSPEEALKVLSDVEGSVLLDIRGKSVADEDGSPSLRKLKKKVTMVAFEIEEDGTFADDPEFASKVAAKPGFEDKTTATVVVIDRSGLTGKKAANTLAKAGYTSLFYVKGGAEQWKAGGLPWKAPRKSVFTVDIDSIKEVISSTVKENPNLVPTTLGVAAAAGASVVFLTEVETTLQVVGSLALLQFLVRKFLFAKDRKQTLEEINALLSSREEFVNSLKSLQKFSSSVLTGELEAELAQGRVSQGSESAVSAKMLPTEATVVDSTPAVDMTAESAPATSHADPATSHMSDASGGKLVDGNSSIAKAVSEPAEEVATPEAPSSHSSMADEVPKPSSRPLSPYTMYPDLKPPTSPTPSKP